jgi:hypothetical protein
MFVLEVKCPFSLRFVKEHELRPYRFPWPSFLTAKKELVKHHDYYHQVQGQMFATNTSRCDFVVWTPNFCWITEVKADLEWRDDKLPRLDQFYKDFIDIKLKGMNV